MRNSSGSAKQYFFNHAPSAQISRCRIRRPSTHKTTINTDYIYPLYWDEVLPGDTFKMNVSTVARMTTLLAPIMDNLWMDWHFFFVPNRLVWSDFTRMMGEREDPDTSIDVTIPYVTAPSGGISAMTIGDYMGLPIGVQWRNHDVMALPLRAYQLIWNEWYRDENLQDSIKVKKDNTIQSITDFSLLKRGKRKDYFTSALPQPQKGDPIMLPIGSSAPVFGDGLNIGLTDGTSTFTLADRAAGASNAHVAALSIDGYGNELGTNRGDTFLTSAKAVGVVPRGTGSTPNKSGMYADLSLTEGVSIDDVRTAFALQRLLERDNIGGTRYIELIKAQFGVTSPDARLQRPEFLGSFTVPVNVHTITQTSESGTTPQGTLTGVGTVNSVNRCFVKSFTEHGMILGLCSIRADLSYQQGIARKWSRSSKYDIFWPPLSHIGEQAILNKELFAQGTSDDDEPFGYQERWSEYKFGENRISGQLRSAYSQSLDFWHLSQNFAALPTLNSDFISESVPLDRSLALSSNVAPQFIVDTLFDVTCVRPMPMYDNPGLKSL